MGQPLVVGTVPPRPIAASVAAVTDEPPSAGARAQAVESLRAAVRQLATG